VVMYTDDYCLDGGKIDELSYQKYLKAMAAYNDNQWTFFLPSPVVISRYPQISVVLNSLLLVHVFKQF